VGKPLDPKEARKRAGGWYKSERWQKLRAHQLARRPFCQCPACEGKQVRAEVVDHITPHRGDSGLFFNAGNLQSLSKLCHDSAKQSMEKAGDTVWSGCDENGFPLDKKHRFYDSR
jgi:5-methylcytosine-specific restriction protein A